MKALTREEFIEKCKKTHFDDDYDYSKTVYISMKKTPYITYYCNKHNKYITQLVYNHLRGCGCDECGKEKRAKSQTKKFEDFVKECRNKYGDEYEYYNEGYENTKSYINIKHNICGKIFKQLASNHLYGGNGCPFCYGKDKLTTEDFINKSKQIFGEALDYSKVEYKRMDKKVILICNKCGLEFSKAPNLHLFQKQGCPRCNKKHRRTIKELIEELEAVNKDLDYSKVEFKNIKTKITTVCKKCGKEYKALVSNILRGHTCLCSINYRGENRISQFLDKYKVNYTKHKTYDDLKKVRELSYDFYLPKYELLIEYNGEQHYEPIDFFGGMETFKIQQLHDELKKEYAEKNKINLLIIPYWDFNNIEKILGEVIENS